jgi:Translation machinery associated TMA7
LKAPKKAPKGELDEEDKAFQEKQKAGKFLSACCYANGFTDFTAQMPKPRLSLRKRQEPARVLSTPDPKESRKAARNEQSNERTSYVL